jgi:hypothetical protein
VIAVKYRFIVLLVIIGSPFAASPGFAGAVTPEPILERETAPVWDGPQFVQADRAGNVFFLQANSLNVYALDKTGDFGKPFRLQPTDDNLGPVHSATLSSAGDQWLVYEDFSVRRFIDGKEKPTPALNWNPWGGAFLRDTPVVAVIPRPLDRIRNLPKAMDVPWLLKLDGDRWSPVTKLKTMDVAGLLKTGGMNEAIAENAVFLKDDREGRLWVAHQYSYHIQRFSSGGRLLLDITVDGGKVEAKKKENKGIEIKLHGAGDNPSEATRDARKETATYFPFAAEPVILSLAVGRDGRFYFLVRTKEGGAALDRYDPERVVLERLQLQLKPEGTFTMAAGRDAIYLAAWEGRKGRWRIPWETLEQVQWKSVKNAEIDGFKANEDAAPEKPAAKAKAPQPR